MLALRSPLRCVALGLLVTAAQIALAMSFSASAFSLADRYFSLIQHDSYWFANIVNRGYATPVPPADHKEMEISNVAFFPAYPLVAQAVKLLSGLDTYYALLAVAQAATWGFWSYFFLFCDRWRLGMELQLFGALAIAVHPAAFYLVAGYSESLFLMTLVGLIYWSTNERRASPLLATLHGFMMSATRIVGLPCALIPLLYSAVAGTAKPARTWPERIARYRRPLFVAGVSMLGGIAFFGYCQIRWGRWDIYMLTQEAGWGIDPDYLAAFRPHNYRFVLPPLHDTTIVSQFTSAVAGVLFLVIGAIELVLVAVRGSSGWRERISFYFAAAVIYFFSLAGVASVQMESMLRYDLCVHALIVFGVLHFLHQLRFTSVLVRAVAMGVASLVYAAALALQGFYVWNFTQGNWVA